jgi:predicted aminopeptidase
LPVSVRPCPLTGGTPSNVYADCRHVLRVLLPVTVAVMTTACATLGYYSQSASGQLDVMARRQPVEALVNAPSTDPQLRRKLKTVEAIRRFASDTLALPDNGSYTLYADIERPFAVWNVFAAPELSMQLKTWCYPFAGCVAYRGYFAETDAARFADGLRQQGYDVYSGGVTAYSTLGWFDDPVLNTVLDFSEARLAGLIFHELAHQQLYVAGDTAFNESFATAVELAGVAAWLEERGDASAAREYHRFHERQTGFYALVAQTREQLLAVYASDAGDAEKRQEKQRQIAAMRANYAAMRRDWGGEGSYDSWFAGDINNAQLAATATYREYLPAFQQILRQSAGDFAGFYTIAAGIGRLPADARGRRLQAIVDAGEAVPVDMSPAYVSGTPCIP